MPVHLKNSKPAASGWSIVDDIEQCRGKLHLKENERRTFYESSQVSTCHNEDKILHLRQVNKKHRIAFADSINTNAKLIKDAFQDNREERLALQRKTAQKAIEDVYEKLCERANKLNVLRFETDKRLKKLDEISNLLEFKLDVYRNGPDGSEAEQIKRKLENNLDKALIKCDTATKIQKNYGIILKKLKEENLTYPDKLDGIETDIKSGIEELRELKTVATNAKSQCDDVRKQLSTLEKESLATKRARDWALNHKKKFAQKLKDSDKINERRPHHRATIHTDDHSHDVWRAAAEIRKRETRHHVLRDAFMKVKEATNVSELRQMVDYLNSQMSITYRLELKKNSKETWRNELTDRFQELDEQCRKAKRNADVKASSGQNLLEKMQDHCDTEGSRSEENRIENENIEELLVEIKTGVWNLYGKLRIMKIPPNIFAGANDPVVQLDIVRKKLTTLNSRIRRVKEEGISMGEIYEFIEASLPRDNVRIKIIDDEGMRDDDGYDFGDNQTNNESLTRQQIKLQGERLIESKIPTKPKKRVRRKGNQKT